MAKVILEQMLKEKGLVTQFEVDSAARHRPDSTSAHPNSRETIKELYHDDLLADHVPKGLTTDIVEKADLIMVMEDHMKAGLPVEKVVVLRITDPFGSDIGKYRACAATIERCLKELWPTIIGLEQSTSRTANASRVTLSPDVSSLAVDWVYDKVVKLAKNVDYGRGEHAATVTRLMLNMYDNMVAIGLIRHTTDKRKLAELAGLCHDVGVGCESPGEGHHRAGLRMVKEKLWSESLTADRKDLLAVILYAIFYHRDSVPQGKLEALEGIPLEDYRACAELLALLRVADGLDFGLVKGTPDKIEKVEMTRTPGEVECRITPRPGKDVTSLLAKAQEKSEVFKACFGKLTFWLPGTGKSWALWDARK
jgi:protein-tyrosine-phosphatase